MQLEPTATDQRLMRFAVIAVAVAAPVVVVLAAITLRPLIAAVLGVCWVVLAVGLFRSPMWQPPDDE